jgi:hypothetical protein
MGIAGSSVVRLLGLAPSNAAAGNANGDASAVGSASRWRGWGRTGSAPLPGSSQVEDPSTGRIANCTAQRCPFAEPHPTNPAVLVNRAPHPGRGPFYLVLNKSPKWGPAGQLAAWRAAMAALMPEASWARVTDPRVFVSPVRGEQLSTESVPVWEAAGWNAADVADYLAALRYGDEHRNAVPPLRFIGGEKIVEQLGRAAEAAVADGSLGAADVAQVRRS